MKPDQQKSSYDAATYLGISIDELHSYDKLISYTMRGFNRIYRVKDLDLLKLRLEDFKGEKL
jgi:DNA-binding transcriptional MerR regulator